MLSAKKQKELRETLPYGVYIGADGRETLFNRRYQPMMTRAKQTDAPTMCNPNDWIEHTEQGFFFNDWNSPFYADNKRHKETRARCENVLIAFQHGEPIGWLVESWSGGK